MIRCCFIVLSLCLSGCTAARVITHTVNNEVVNAPSGRYLIDAEHASLIFDVDHLGFSRFTGRFNVLAATLDFLPGAIGQSQLTAAVTAASLDTPVEQLDALIKGPGMLDTARFPEIRFESDEIIPVSPSQAQVRGSLTLHGVTRQVTLDVHFNGWAKNPLTQKHTLGFSASGAFSRSSFGLGRWIPAVGDQVRVRIEAEFILQDNPA